MDTIAHVLCEPQRPLVTTQLARVLHADDAPTGVNAIVAIMVCGGYNQEDSIIMNRSACERGLFRSEKYVTVRDEERPTGGDNDRFCNPAELPDCQGLRVGGYGTVDASGAPRVGARVRAGDVLIGKAALTSSIGEAAASASASRAATASGAPAAPPQRKTPRDRSTLHRSEEGVVDSVLLTRRNGARLRKVKVRSVKTPNVGDKFSSRMGQKGVVGRLLGQHELPFTADGVVPDVIVNPHAIPSRMTLGMLMECLLGKLASVKGEVGDATAFHGTTIEDIAAALAAEGFDGMGNETMYCPHTGEAYQAAVFLGPTYYQRLKHMVDDKIHSRARGPVTLLTRQPMEGRARDGGLRFGEMERDCMIAHGVASIMKERLFECSDQFRVHVCDLCGLIAIANLNKGVFECRGCRNKTKVSQVFVPYACKLLFQELMSMQIAPRML